MDSIIRIVSHKLFLVFSFITILLPSLVLSLDEYIDPFTFHTVGLAQIYYREGNYFIYPIVEGFGWQSTANEISFRFVPILFQLILSQITGISLWHLLFWPIIGFIFPIIAYLFCKNLQQQTTIAVIYAVTISYSFFFINLFYISVGMLFFLVFIFVLLKFLNFGQFKKIYVGLLLFIFIIIYFTYYTAELLALSYLTSVLFIPWFLEKFGIKTHKLKLHSLLFSFIVIFIGFERVLYQFFEMMSIEKGLNLFYSYVNYVLNLLRKGTEAVFEYRPHIGIPLVVYIDYIQQIIIWGSIAIYLLYIIIRTKIIKKDSAVLTLKGLVLLAFFTAGISETLIYLLVGYGIYTRTLSLFSPLLALYSLNKFYVMFYKRKKKILNIVIIIIILFIVSASIVKFALRVSDPLNPNGARLHSKMKITISWVAFYTTNRVVIADLRIIGQTFFELINEEKVNSIKLIRMGSEVRYLYSFSNETVNKVFRERNTLFILSYEFKERFFIAGEAWRLSPPLKEAFSFLDYYTLINRVFDDGQGIVYDYS